MQQFISRFQDLIQGAVSGFDRVLFRGSLRPLNPRLKEASTAAFREQNLPVVYLRRRDTDKDQTARGIAAERRIAEGDVCVLSAVELAPSFEHEGTHMVFRARQYLDDH